MESIPYIETIQELNKQISTLSKKNTKITVQNNNLINKLNSDKNQIKDLYDEIDKLKKINENYSQISKYLLLVLFYFYWPLSDLDNHFIFLIERQH